MINKPTGLINQIREEVGINISKRFEVSASVKSQLSQAVEEFFLQDHVTRLCPDKDKCILDPDSNTMVQLRYRLGPIRCIQQQFSIENSTFSDCSLSAFTKNVPFYVAKPMDQDWGTCLCIMSQSPIEIREVDCVKTNSVY